MSPAHTIVSLLRPPVLLDPNALGIHGPTPPIGAAYVAAALRHAGHEVEIVDGAGDGLEVVTAVDSPVGTLAQIGLSPAAIVDRVRPDVEIVGITTMFVHEWPIVRQLADLVRDRFPEALIVLGGENATAFAPYILDQSKSIDGCVLGEGELTMVAIADKHARGASLSGLAGLMRREAEPSQRAEVGLSVRLGKKELNTSIPRPAWDLVPLHRYWEHYPFLGVDRGRSIQLLGTRGCPYKCTFCSSPQMWTTKYVVRDPEDVVDEIADYVERYEIQNVNFVDLTAATNRKWTLGLCDALDERGLDLTWQLPVGTRIEAIDREVLERIYETGCRNILFAPESGSERMLEIMDKRVKLPRVLEAVADARDIGLHTSINIIVGHPAERFVDLIRSYGFALLAAWRGCFDIGVMTFCPYPGSADFADLVARGEHVVDEESCYLGLTRTSGKHSWNRRFTPRQLRLAQVLLIALFYATQWIRRPRRIVSFLRSLVTGSEETYLEQMIRTRRKNLRSKPDGNELAGAPSGAAAGELTGWTAADAPSPGANGSEESVRTPG